MNKILQVFGSLVCGIQDKHVFKVDRRLLGNKPKIKTCQRCGLVREVKQRKGK